MLVRETVADPLYMTGRHDCDGYDDDYCDGDGDNYLGDDDHEDGDHEITMNACIIMRGNKRQGRF